MNILNSLKGMKLSMNVMRMKANSQKSRMWKNVQIAEDCLTLMRKMDADDPQGDKQALLSACDAMVDQLPIYDVPRFTLSILRFEQELLQHANRDSADAAAHVAYNIQKLEDYIDTENISDWAFRKKYGRHLKADPIERTELWEQVYVEAEEETERQLADMPRGMGFCHARWSVFASVLAERGIEWRSPRTMNPQVMFD